MKKTYFEQTILHEKENDNRMSQKVLAVKMKHILTKGKTLSGIKKEWQLLKVAFQC